MAEAGENPGKLSPTFPLACEDDSAAVCHCIQPIARSEGGARAGGEYWQSCAASAYTICTRSFMFADKHDEIE